MTVVGLLAIVAIMASIYHPSTRLTAIFGCIALALIAGTFSAGTSDLSAMVLGHQMPSSTMATSLGFIGALLLGVVALFDPSTETSSNLGDSITVQRTIWVLFLANLIVPFTAATSMDYSQATALVIVVAVAKILVVTLLIEGLWMLRAQLPQLTTTMLIRGSVALSLVTVVLAVSSLAS